MTVKITNHRYGAEATWSHNTDTLHLSSMYNAEIAAFKHNFALTAFDSPWGSTAPIEKIKEMFNSGRVKPQIYFQTDRWKNPNVSSSEPDMNIKFPVIPDYYATSWTQAGMDAGFNVIVGQTKAVRYPNHGTQLFEVSDGLYGEGGQTDVLTELIQCHKDWCFENFGYYPSAASYRNGQQGSMYAMSEHFLGVRNSSHGGRTTYGVNDGVYLGSPQNELTSEHTKSFAGTSRVGDELNLTREESITQSAGWLQNAINSKGWFNDFVHWHSSPDTELEEFYQSQRETITTSGKAVVALDMGAALEHKYLRDMADVTETVVGSNIELSVTFTEVYMNMPLEVFTIPLSVEFDATGTPLEGKDITSGSGFNIVKLDVNKYVIDVTFTGLTTTNITLTETLTPDYLDLDVPSITSTTINNGVIIIKTDKPTKLTMFVSNRGSELHTAQPLIRDNDFKTNHTIDMNLTENRNGRTFSDIEVADLYAGLITENNQSILSSPIQLKVMKGIDRIFIQIPNGKLSLPVFNESSGDDIKIATPNGTAYLHLVDVNDMSASSARIQTPAGIKAIETD